MTDQLAVIVEESGLAPAQIKPIVDDFGDYFMQAHKLATEAKGITVTSIDDVDGMARAREVRLALREVRINADKTRKVLKEGYLRGGNAVQKIFNDIRDVTKPEEDRLLGEEQYAKRIKEAEDNEVQAKREMELSRYVESISLFRVHPNDMSTETYDKLLASSKKTHEALKKAEEDAEERRIEAEEKKDIQNNRFREIAPLTDFIVGHVADKITLDMTDEAYLALYDQAEKAKKKHDKKQEKIRLDNKKLRDDASKQKIKEANIREAERQKLAKANKKIADAKEKLKAEQDEKRQIEADRLAKIEVEQKAKEDADLKALLAPDKEKLLEFSMVIGKIKAPSVKTKNADEVLDEAMRLLENAIRSLQTGANNL